MNTNIEILKASEKSILLFDGVCNLCNRWVRFVVRKDPNKKVLFIPIQSVTGQKLVEELALDVSAMGRETVFLLKNGTVYVESDAILELAKELSGIIRIAGAGWVVPGNIRNYLYRWVAKNRYRWFGKRDRCMVPDDDTADRFITE
ncbi:thiol-disulfide oxidoreductase DCC family protein [Balneolaceae bacterium ANBcel3]|nr:thiol-disulfide oxidoreductase DCC family protein [Balneolaceae bacterium ANBcel3]